MGSKADLHRIVPLIQEGRLHPVVDRAFPLADAAAAHERLEARENFGKVVLTVE
jgi:NADPH:quinone reductase-like Zn-dependent oxidoreductase